MQDAFHLYVISFTVGAESGLAMVAAQDEKSAFQILKNGGSRHCDGYSLIQTRDIGMTANCHYGLLLESYVNALQAFEAITSVANYMKGPAGEPGKEGPPGPQGADGRQGIDGASLVDVQQTQTSTEDGGYNEITFTLADQTRRKVYIRNGDEGRPGVTEVHATADAIVSPTPSVTVYLNDEGALYFTFSGFKGIQGNPGVSNARIVITDDIEEETPSIDTMDIVFWQYNENSGEYDRFITQFDGEDYYFVQIGDTSIDLSDYQRKDDEVWLTQEEFDALTIKDITKVYNIYEESDQP